MSEWQPVRRDTPEDEPTVVIGTEPTTSVPDVPAWEEPPAERTQVLDTSSFQAPPPPAPAPARRRTVMDDLAQTDPRDDPEYAHQLDRMENRRWTDVGLRLLRLASLPLVLRGLHQLFDLSPEIARLRELPILGAAPDIAAVALGAAEVALPLLLAVGLFTRGAALLQAAALGLLYAATVLAGAPVLDAQAGGLADEATLAYAALALPLVFTGAGRYSIDHGLGTDRRARLAERRVLKQQSRRGG